MTKTTRNILIVSACAVGGGWLGAWLNAASSSTLPPLQSLGALVWLALPALAGLLLRLLGGDGWQDAGLGLNLPGGWRWYLAALWIYPLGAALAGGLALALQAINLAGFAAQGLQAYLAAAGALFGASLVKNLFEELAWRGYLTPRLAAANVHPLANHAAVALVWWAWHLPYYAYFLGRADLQAAAPYGAPLFLGLALVNLLPTALLFGELRLNSRSIWPGFLLHQVINALSMPLVLNGFITSRSWTSLIFSPSNDSLLMGLLLGLAGWWMYRRRTAQLQQEG